MIFKRDLAQNESGFALVAAMVILMILVAVGIFALNTSSFEMLIAANDKVIKEDFYNQERCIARAKVNYRTWLTNDFLTSGETTASFPPNPIVDNNGNGFHDAAECLDPHNNLVGVYRVRKIEEAGAAINNWSDVGDFDAAADHPANSYPQRSHVDIPPPGSGFDQKNFVARMYVITSYSPDNNRNSVIQEGAYMIFNKNKNKN